MRTPEIERRLSASRLFAGLSSRLVARIAAETTTRAHRAGEALWRAGDPAASFTVIQSGLVEIVRTAPGGETAMLGLFGPREAIGVAAVLERAPYPAAALALTDDVQVLSVRAAPVLELAAEDASVAMALNRALLEHTAALRSKIDVLSSGSVPRRLAALLLHLAERFGDEDESSATRIPIAMSRAQLASVVGARVETVIRTLGRWQREGWLESGKEGFSLQSGALRRILGTPPSPRP